MMKRACNILIDRAVSLAQDLVSLADEGDAASDDNRCVLLFGIVRDCAYRVRRQAEGERERRRLMGLWEDAGADCSGGMRAVREGKR